MSQPIDMGPQPTAENINVSAMKVDFRHKCYSVEDGKEPVISEVTLFYPINEGVWIPMYPQCAECGCQLQIISREVIR